MAKIVKKSPAPLYLAAAVWAAWAVLAPLYAWWHFALAAAVSAAAWLGGRKLFPDKVLILPDPEPAPEREPERAAPEDPLLHLYGTLRWRAKCRDGSSGCRWNIQCFR